MPSLLRSNQNRAGGPGLAFLTAGSAISLDPSCVSIYLREYPTLGAASGAKKGYCPAGRKIIWLGKVDNSIVELVFRVEGPPVGLKVNLISAATTGEVKINGIGGCAQAVGRCQWIRGD